MRQQNLLIELGTEELPPKVLKQLSESFSNAVVSGLQQAELTHGQVKPYATPRRLAVYIESLAEQQADKVVEKRGPSVDVAFDAEGKPTKAAEGWARSNGITVDQAERLSSDKGEWLLHKAEVKGQTLSELLPEIVEQALKQLPIPKPMRWGDSDAQFIRPVHTYTLLYGDQLIAGTALGIASARHIQGHRFHSPQGFELQHADDYETALHDAYVIADFAKRQQKIADAIAARAAELAGRIAPDAELLEEVTALVEWPVVLDASFSKDFLDVPKEPLIVTMKDDQRYFPLEDENGQLLPRFIFVTNIESHDASQIIAGNERVVTPRLADAQFFFNSDKKHRLESRLQDLANVLFQKQLGSMADKCERISALAGKIASRMQTDASVAARAGLLAKADLATQMVSEFPETQGVMGMHYARHDGEGEAVASAIYEHYLPRFSGDVLPTSAAGAAVALADKLDTLVGIFGIGQVPKGDRDPFALRRAAIGLLRIIAETPLALDLRDLVQDARDAFGERLTNKDTVEQVVEFVLSRCRPWYQEQGIAVDVIQAVLANRPTRPADIDSRVRAVSEFRGLEQAASLAAANKRVSNILAKLDGELPQQVDSQLLVAPQEKHLAEQLTAVEAIVTPAVAAGNYTVALKALAELRDSIDAFFDNVMVNDDDAAIRQNRQALLNQLRQAFLQIADISLLQ